MAVFRGFYEILRHCEIVSVLCFLPYIGFDNAWVNVMCKNNKGIQK